MSSGSSQRGAGAAGGKIEKTSDVIYTSFKFESFVDGCADQQK